MLIIHEKSEPAGHKLSEKSETERQIMQKVISMWNMKVIKEQKQIKDVMG